MNAVGVRPRCSVPLPSRCLCRLSHAGVQSHLQSQPQRSAPQALASNETIAYEFVDELWDLAIPTGSGRYYNGMLYAWALLFVSGEFKAYL